MALLPIRLGVVLVDHGSTLQEANDLLAEVAKMFARVSGVEIVEIAHMELAEPTLAQAFSRCVARGAESVVIYPYFLAPGRHSTEDIPQLATEAAAGFPEVVWRVAKPLGADERIGDVILTRIEQSLIEG